MADNFANPTPAVTPSMGNNDIYKIQIDNASSSRAPSQPAVFALQDKLAQTVKSINDIVAGFDEFNILEYYHWTLSQNKSNIIPFIPKLIATEYDIVTTPVVQNLKYTLSVLAGTAGTTSDAVNKFLGDDPKWKNVFDTQTVNDLKDNIENFGNKARDYANDLAKNNEMDFENNMELREKYKHLYTVKRTGKRFIFPYLEENFLSLANDFSETNEYLSFGSFNTSEMSKTILKSLTQLPSLLSPGAYIQAPKFYDFGKVGEPSVTIHFPLYNTINSYHTERNIKFVKIFGLNNMPHRKSMLQVDPSRIYSVKIPGKAFFPFCYVSSYDVKHVGNKSLFINDIYPEAYNISITFTSLIKYDVNMFKGEMKMNADYDAPTRRPTATIYDKDGNALYSTPEDDIKAKEGGNSNFGGMGDSSNGNRGTGNIESDIVTPESIETDQTREAGFDSEANKTSDSNAINVPDQNISPDEETTHINSLLTPSSTNGISGKGGRGGLTYNINGEKTGVPQLVNSDGVNMFEPDVTIPFDQINFTSTGTNPNYVLKISDVTGDSEGAGVLMDDDNILSVHAYKTEPKKESTNEIENIVDRYASDNSSVAPVINLPIIDRNTKADTAPSELAPVTKSAADAIVENSDSPWRDEDSRFLHEEQVEKLRNVASQLGKNNATNVATPIKIDENSGLPWLPLNPDRKPDPSLPRELWNALINPK